MSRSIIDIHILETIATGNINRDDTGTPKTQEYGGVVRARVSSQSWKRPTRFLFDERFDDHDLGVRTKRCIELLADAVEAKRPDIDHDTAMKYSETLFSKPYAGIKNIEKGKTDKKTGQIIPPRSPYLLYMGRAQYDRLADIAIEMTDTTNAASKTKSEWKKRVKNIIENDRAIDVALFGRMFTDDANLNIEAATEVAHAISVHGVETESDYYTAVDDMKSVSGDEDSGAAMVGDIEFNSATFYRYANVDANRLNDTLADPKVSARAAAEFVRAFAMSIPTGKIHGFAQRALPDLIIVSLRDTQPVNLATAFRIPVKPDYVEHATERLVAQEHAFDKAFDVTPIRTWVIRADDAAKDADQLGEVMALKEAVDDIETTVRDRLANETEA